MLFKKRFWAGIPAGSINLTFRRWKRPQAVAGNTYRTPAGRIYVEDVRLVEPAEIPDGDVARAGFHSREELLAELPGDRSQALYRISFRFVAGEDPRDELAASTALSADDLAELERLLARLDRAAREGPWTMRTLEAIEHQPGLRAADLARHLGRDRGALKLDIRKLKNMGLTLSFETGYRLSPRGEQYLRMARRD